MFCALMLHMITKHINDTNINEAPIGDCKTTKIQQQHLQHLGIQPLH